LSGGLVGELMDRGVRVGGLGDLRGVLVGPTGPPGVFVFVRVDVIVGVLVGVGVDVTVNVTVSVGVSVGIGVSVGVPVKVGSGVNVSV
jgi:hypothetical protein